MWHKSTSTSFWSYKNPFFFPVVVCDTFYDHYFWKHMIPFWMKISMTQITYFQTVWSKMQLSCYWKYFSCGNVDRSLSHLHYLWNKQKSMAPQWQWWKLRLELLIPECSAYLFYRCSQSKTDLLHHGSCRWHVLPHTGVLLSCVACNIICLPTS